MVEFYSFEHEHDGFTFIWVGNYTYAEKDGDNYLEYKQFKDDIFNINLEDIKTILFLNTKHRNIIISVFCKKTLGIVCEVP